MSRSRTSPARRRPATSPGVFTGYGHRIPDEPLTMVLDGPFARLLGLDGHTVYFAICGAACWEPTDDALDLPRCPNGCRKTQGRSR